MIHAASDNILTGCSGLSGNIFCRDSILLSVTEPTLYGFAEKIRKAEDLMRRYRNN